MDTDVQRQSSAPASPPAQNETGWSHSGFGADSALEAMKRAARTKPAVHPPMPPQDMAPRPKAADRHRERPGRTRKAR
ncbi:MAG TPA: hypothetical protein VFM98_10045 [Ramlibacter sp.]|uniref:hypothetical protein n=1 Tax=Ramlibacter sp. TaxID=1917967 RepID=UPI002D800524|nr:hypothetical protein [Ramlibacter sp.]HET8745938.1 hypothetical protein [Ramlibacter sp.]